MNETEIAEIVKRVIKAMKPKEVKVRKNPLRPPKESIPVILTLAKADGTTAMESYLSKSDCCRKLGFPYLTSGGLVKVKKLQHGLQIPYKGAHWTVTLGGMPVKL